MSSSAALAGPDVAEASLDVDVPRAPAVAAEVIRR
jgi:hypothetical protein